MFPSARASLVLALHAVVLALIAAFVAVLALKQQNPFKKHYRTMVAFLVDVFIYAMIVVLSIKLEGFAEEVATSASILLGLLGSQLLILIMVPILGWFCLALWVLLLFFIVYRLISGRNRGPPRQKNPSQNQVGIQDRVIISRPAPQDYNQSQAHAITSQPAQVQEYNQSHDHMTIEMTASQDGPINTGKRWISVYNLWQEKFNQVCHRDVDDSLVFQRFNLAKQDCSRLFIRSVASRSNLWALIMNDVIGFSEQDLKLSPNFLPDEWIKEHWDEGFDITAIAGADNGSSLVVMSKGTQFLNQTYKVNDPFPSDYIEDMQKREYFITAMATSGSKWAVVVSKGAGFSSQYVRFDGDLSDESIRAWSDHGYSITATAATADKVAFVFSRRLGYLVQNKTLSTSDFPDRQIAANCSDEFYVSSICYGAPTALSVLSTD
ncbi:hypothetical protein L484_020208 [Morus notabilis]|uniref:DUF7477 domain-containing protein n=1 Tax=Morus notabilis TaxID=981085 RepID=W9RXY3_9ROSA|nr:hypothetical protein L484_020208 [Morus notabilis]